MKPILAIGVSAGGFEALSRLLPEIPERAKTAVIVVIHLTNHAAGFADVFNEKVRLSVKEVDDKDSILPGTIYFAPAGYHLLVEPDYTFSLSVEPPVHFSRPSIDVLFESVAIAGRDQVTGLLLTGANDDGAEGLKCIQEMGGVTWVQDPQDAEYETMPRSALEIMKPDRVMSLDELVEKMKTLQ